MLTLNSAQVVGQYSLCDVSFVRLHSINNLHGLYWKQSKDFAPTADGRVANNAHVVDSIFANGGPSSYGMLQALGPAGSCEGNRLQPTCLKSEHVSVSVELPSVEMPPCCMAVTFVMRNTTFIGGPVGCGAICAGQHCGLASHNGGVHGSLCNVQYLLEQVDFEQVERGSASLIAFGASGGNPSSAGGF